MVGTTNSLVVGLQLFGTLFIVLISFLGMTAWIIRRIDRVADIVTDQGRRLAQLEGKIDAGLRNSK